MVTLSGGSILLFLIILGLVVTFVVCVAHRMLYAAVQPLFLRIASSLLEHSNLVDVWWMRLFIPPGTSKDTHLLARDLFQTALAVSVIIGLLIGLGLWDVYQMLVS